MPVTKSFPDDISPSSVNAVYDPTSHTLVAAAAGIVTTDSTTGISYAPIQTTGGSGGSGGAVTIANGADVAQGSTTDSAYSSGAGSIVSILKGVFTRLANIPTIAFDNTSRLQASLYGKNSAAGDTPLLLNPDGSAQIDLRKVAGSALSLSNPLITQDFIRTAIANGQGFTATNGAPATATNANLDVCALSIFNPSNSGKSVLIYRLACSTQAATTSNTDTIRATTADPSGTTGFTGTFSGYNTKLGSGTASVASLCSSATGISASVTPTGTAIGLYGTTANGLIELLQNGACFLLPNGSAEGIEVIMRVTTAGNLFSAMVQWIEF
jgi:hypothetical protein